MKNQTGSCCPVGPVRLSGKGSWGQAIRSGTSAGFIRRCVHMAWGCVFSARPGSGPRSKTGIGFPQSAMGGSLQLTCDDLVRCEHALSNLEQNKLQVIFYETSVPGCLKTFPPTLLCTVSPNDVFIKSTPHLHHTHTHTTHTQSV